MVLLMVGVLAALVHFPCHGANEPPNRDSYIAINDDPAPPHITQIEDLIDRARAWHAGTYARANLIRDIQNCQLPRHQLGAALYDAGILDHAMYRSDEQWTRQGLHWLKIFTFIFGLTSSLSGGFLLTPALIGFFILIVVLIDVIIKAYPQRSVRRAIQQASVPRIDTALLHK